QSACKDRAPPAARSPGAPTACARGAPLAPRLEPTDDPVRVVDGDGEDDHPVEDQICAASAPSEELPGDLLDAGENPRADHRAKEEPSPTPNGRPPAVHPK